VRVRGKRVGELTADDLEALVAAKAPESRELEYKLELPGRSDSDKKEFLADVAAFANTVGGVLLYGVETERDERGGDTGIPLALRGVRMPNFDAELRRLAEILRDGLDPRLVPEPVFQVVAMPRVAQPVLALGISRSFASPHMLSYQRSGRFFRRSSVAKSQADVREIRAMFMEADAWAAEARKFCEGRVAVALAGGLGVDDQEVVHRS